MLWLIKYVMTEHWRAPQTVNLSPIGCVGSTPTHGTNSPSRAMQTKYVSKIKLAEMPNMPTGLFMRICLVVGKIYKICSHVAKLADAMDLGSIV